MGAEIKYNFKKQYNNMKNIIHLIFCLLCATLSAQTQWQHIPGPDGGFIKHLEQDSSAVYALSNSRIFRSDDEGMNWTELPGSLMAGHAVDEFTVENSIFYGKKNDKNEILRSEDGGKTWKSIFQKTINDPVSGASEIIFSVFAHEQNVLIVTSKSIYRSTDKGDTWAASPTDLFGYNLKGIFLVKGEYFAWGGRYIYRSSDGGVNWTRVFSGAFNFLAVNAVGDKIFALHKGAKRITQSVDGFRTWKNTDSNTMWKGEYNDGDVTAIIKGYGSFIACFFYVYSNTSDITGAKMSFSVDGGQTWEVWENDEFDTFLPINTYDAIIYENHILHRTRTGLLRSDYQIAHILPSDKGLNACNLSQLIPTPPKVFVNSIHALFWLEKKNNTWHELARVPAELDLWWIFAQIAGNDKVIHAYVPLVMNQFSNDFGETWNTTSTEYTQFTQNYAWLNESWSETATRLSNDLTFEKEIDFSERLGNYYIQEPIFYQNSLCLKIFDKTDFLKRSIWVTNEEGQIILEAPASPCLSSSFSHGLYYDGKNLTEYCGTNAYAFNTEDKEWKPFFPIDWTTGTPLYHDLTRRIYIQDGITFIVINGKGIFYSTDNTGRFYPMNPQPPYPYISSLILKDNKLWAGTDGNGIYVTDFKTPDNQPERSVNLNLYPNPSNGHMTLSSDLFLTEYSPFTLHDATGKVVAERELPPGNRWDLDFDLPQGVYFLRMLTQNGVVGKKWVLR
jgi:photosystem II stability/assembly factor-like uncharacterized protein